MPEPLIIIPGDIDQNRGYRVTKWHQHDNYECIYCQYATLWIEKMEKHQVEGTHVWSFPDSTMSDQLSDLPENDKPEY